MGRARKGPTTVRLRCCPLCARPMRPSWELRAWAPMAVERTYGGRGRVRQVPIPDEQAGYVWFNDLWRHVVPLARRLGYELPDKLVRARAKKLKGAVRAADRFMARVAPGPKQSKTVKREVALMRASATVSGRAVVLGVVAGRTLGAGGDLPRANVLDVVEGRKL